jgi:Cft2 family RNA processing exonuclease
MMGSRQLAVVSPEGERIVYTGDFQMQKSRVAEYIEIPQADTVIIDSTYPFPKVRFDDRCETETAIQKWTTAKLERGSVLFGAYAMGKSQELISILNEIGIAPLVSPKIANISATYSGNGYKLDYVPLGSGAEAFVGLGHSFVSITEKPLADTASRLASLIGAKVFTGVATGFAKSFRFDTDVQFALSDHADFVQSVDYINATGAKTVLTYGKGATAFAANLCIAGFNAKPFPSTGAGSAADYPHAVFM